MKRTAAILLALLTMAGSAHTFTVSKEVGPLLQEAQKMIAAKNYEGAMATEYSPKSNCASSVAQHLHRFNLSGD